MRAESNVTPLRAGYPLHIDDPAPRPLPASFREALLARLGDDCDRDISAGEASTLGLWLATRTVIDPDAVTPVCGLWYDHARWAMGLADAEPLQPEPFRAALAAMVPAAHQLRGFVRGLALRPS